MRIARHQHPLILLTLLQQFVVGYLHQFVAGKEFQIHQHLVVTRTSRVDFLAHVTQFTGEHQFHLRVDILHPVFYLKLAAFTNGIYLFQLSQQLFQLVSLQQSYRLKHGDMRHRAHHVVGSQVEIHLPVSSHREALYLGIHLKILFPQFIHL